MHLRFKLFRLLPDVQHLLQFLHLFLVSVYSLVCGGIQIAPNVPQDIFSFDTFQNPLHDLVCDRLQLFVFNGFELYLHNGLHKAHGIYPELLMGHIQTAYNFLSLLVRCDELISDVNNFFVVFQQRLQLIHVVLQALNDGLPPIAAAFSFDHHLPP